MLQEPAGEQRGALERSAAVAAGTVRVGDQEGHGTHGARPHRRRRGLPPETTGVWGSSTHTHKHKIDEYFVFSNDAYRIEKI